MPLPPTRKQGLFCQNNTSMMLNIDFFIIFLDGYSCVLSWEESTYII